MQAHKSHQPPIPCANPGHSAGERETFICTYPMPQLSQQLSRSSEEISTLTLALLWIHTRSEMASAAPNAFRGTSMSNTHSTSQISHRNIRVCVLTQQLPQEPWSLTSFRVGQLGHCSLGSKFLGSSMSPVYCTLQRREQGGH